MPHEWNRYIVVGWFGFFGVFLGVDALVWLLGIPRIPTFSRTVCRLLPWYVVLPLTAVLFFHFLDIYVGGLIKWALRLVTR